MPLMSANQSYVDKAVKTMAKGTARIRFRIGMSGAALGVLIA
jgi:hypothetical protein